MFYNITDLKNGSYKITFSEEESGYNFETFDNISTDKLTKSILLAFKGIPGEVTEVENGILIKYVPNNILRIIDRVNNVVNAISKGFNLYDNYEKLFTEYVLPYGKMMTSIDLNLCTNKEECTGTLYNKKIINEQYYNPKNSISNCLSHRQDEEFWSDKNYLHKLSYEDDKDERINKLINENNELKKQLEENVSVKHLNETIERQQQYIKTLQNKINDLEYALNINK